MKKEWDRNRDERDVAYKAEEEARKEKFQSQVNENLNKASEDVNKEINAASKTPKGRLIAARQIMCKATRDYNDQTLDLRNPQGAISREYKYNASRDAFFSMLESSGGNKYHRFEDSPTTYNRYCK
jgi:hypothetical protein